MDQPPGVPRARSTYLQHLPGIYQDSDFIGRFLLIFEHILAPIERTIGNLPHYLDPRIAPDEVSEWLGSWLGMVFDDRWPSQRRRDLVTRAAELYAWRGTRRGLREFIRLYTGFQPEIEEPTLSEVAANRVRGYRFSVRIRVPAGTTVDPTLIERIIEMEKPAFAIYTLEIVQE